MIRFPKEIDKVVDKYLKVWYAVLNREIFNGKLPKKAKVYSERSSELRGCCLVRNKKVVGIWVDPRDSEPVRVLLHEMVHAYQSVVLKYPDSAPDHDHAFWQKLQVCERKLVRVLNSYAK